MVIIQNLRIDGRSLMNIEKSNGPITEPCGTPMQIPMGVPIADHQFKHGVIYYLNKYVSFLPLKIKNRT